MGVLLSRTGRHDDALDAFRHAIAAGQDYGIGWFNFGSELLLHGDVGDLLAAQGALGIAHQLDPSLRSTQPAPIFDEEFYEAGLDLSKSLPTDWSLEDTARRPTVPITVLLVVLAVLQGGLALLSGHTKEHIATRLAESVSRSARSHRLSMPAWVGMAATAIVLTLGLGTGGVRETVLAIPLALSLAVLPVAIRGLAAGTRLREQETPIWALAMTSLLQLLGCPWATATTSRASTDPDARSTSGAVPLILISVSAIAFFSAALTLVPSARAGFGMCIAAVGAALVPIPHNDGARIGRFASAMASLALFAAAAAQAFAVV